jgi:hypothetical protein
LAQFAIDFGARELKDNPLMWQNSAHGNPYATHPRVIHTDTNPIEIELVIDNPNPLFNVRLNAQRLRASDDKIRTLVTGQLELSGMTGDEIDQQLTERYQSLFDELNRFGLVELPQEPQAPTAPSAAPSEWQKGNAGRKPDKSYDTAFGMIDSGTPQNKVREWYFQENKLLPSDQQAAKNFNDAMRRRKRARNRKISEK